MKSTIYGAKITSNHSVEINFDGGAIYSLHCREKLQSRCHAVFNCDCEIYYNYAVIDGLPRHETSGDEVHIGRFIESRCTLKEWFDGDSSFLDGNISFPVYEEWTGDEYIFNVNPEMPDHTDTQGD